VSAVAVLADTGAHAITAEISAFIPPPSEGWAALQDASQRFLQTPWHAIAIEHGWSVLEVWGCFPSGEISVVRRRYDALGLVPALFWGLSCSIEALDGERCVVSRRAIGSRLVHQRRLTGSAVVWWEAPAAGAMS
jgi:hypothetical protein